MKETGQFTQSLRKFSSNSRIEDGRLDLIVQLVKKTLHIMNLSSINAERSGGKESNVRELDSMRVEIMWSNSS